MLEIIHHLNHPTWTPVNQRLKRTNGAFTYSEDIIKFYAPIFEELYGENKKNVLLMTVNNDWDAQWKGFDVIFLFIHEWNAKDIDGTELERVRRFKRANKKSRVIFLVNHKREEIEFIENGLEAIWVPMAIDTQKFAEYKKIKKNITNRVIYFGNITARKREPLQELVRCLRLRKFSVDVVSSNRINFGTRLPRDKLLRKIASYKYGVGVGRCAEEMSAMGIKTIIYSHKYKHNDVPLASVITNREEKGLALQDNYCSRYYGENLFDALQKMREIIPIEVDCRDVAEILRLDLKALKI